ncbi:LysR substrate-binding domain-containing protein [Paraburkholderia sp. D15]|uniref:LysR substrate-binding domain-containing protein n=1 Tax=Paraburkholderia sp. D15 TaxID=2880218 RepID=UPI002479F616|nr:LysR substrate-binding domain-containing protein [Paraburkholderia sp. D15]WGS52508.1 LysR substrate-binding domain-containing protein [Paraburkholderia sp. D15]WKF62077.1 Glycine cleavage system transcriptional activator [Paraburkholderia busanensis]
MRRLPPLNTLRSFEAAGRLGSLSKAAEELCVTHSAVTQQIRLLEEYLGQKLFERRGRKLEMTPRARHYLADVASCLGRLSEATEQMGGPAVRRTIRVNTSASFAHGWMIPRLAHFHALHTDIDVQIVTAADMNIDLVDESHDAIIRRFEPNLRRYGFDSRPLIANVAVPVCSPNLRELAALRTPADLRHARLLHFAGIPDAWQYWFRCANVEIGETLGGPFYEQFFLLLQAASNGLGIALAPRAIVDEDVRQGRLAMLFPEVKLEGPPFHCLYRVAPQDRELGRFLDWLFDPSIQTQAAWPQVER